MFEKLEIVIDELLKFNFFYVDNNCSELIEFIDNISEFFVVSIVVFFVFMSVVMWLFINFICSLLM